MDSVGSYNKMHINNLEKLHASAGRIIYELPWGTSADGVLTRTGWDSLETMYKLRLAEFFFKCIKGYLKSFLQRNLAAEEMKTSCILPRPEMNFLRKSIRYTG